MIFSSAFAANLAVISSLIKGQSKDSLLDANTLVVSDELNHRSIVEGIRVANFPDTQRRVFHHFDLSQLEQIFKESKGKFTRVLVVTDGVFSMLGEYQNLEKLRSLIDAYDSKFPQGVLLFVDDCHGIGVLGDTGRGVEQLCGTKSDVLVWISLFAYSETMAALADSNPSARGSYWLRSKLDSIWDKAPGGNSNPSFVGLELVRSKIVFPEFSRFCFVW